MEFLPPELLTKVFSFLDASTTVICGQVCHRWRVLTRKIVNPLYIPEIISAIIHRQHACGKLRDVLKLRLVCKLWKNGLDQLTLQRTLILNGLTILNPQRTSEELTHLWNPFPSRILRLKLCFDHDNPENIDQQARNEEEDLLMERFGNHVAFLQVSLQHADCSKKHLIKTLNYTLGTLQGLVVTEYVSPHRFTKTKQNTESTADTDASFILAELGRLENLKFIKLDDSNCTLKYSDLYRQIIVNSPKLEHLEINGFHHLDMEIIKLLSNRVSGTLPLTHLKMDAESPNDQAILKILANSNLPLKYLSLRINGFGDSCENFICSSLLHIALAKFGGTLERLELKLNWFEKNEDSQPELLTVFPSSKFLTKLVKLKLVGYKGQLDFLKDLVSLEALMIVDFNPQTQNIFTSDETFHQLLPTLKNVFLPLQGTLYSADSSFKKKLQNFMYEGDASFIPKYCGLYQEIFP